MIVDLEKRWIGKALCSTRDPELFFTDQAAGTEPLSNPSARVQRLWDAAKQVCAECPVMKECARDNLGEIEGVWGGLDPAQRIQLRAQHATNIRKLTGPLKQEYMDLAWHLKYERHLSMTDVARTIGVGVPTATFLIDLEKERREDIERKAQAEAKAASAAVSGPAEDAVVVSLPNAEFPAKPPTEGDAWVRYGRRVVWGYYLGQTDDDQWFYLKIKLLAQEYSVCWIKAQDVKLVKPVARNVLTRVGNGSRIYGTALTSGHRGTPQAG